jgi:hypothetical protein
VGRFDVRQLDAIIILGEDPRGPQVEKVEGHGNAYFGGCGPGDLIHCSS